MQMWLLGESENLQCKCTWTQDPKGILEDDVLPDGTKVRAGGMVTYVPYSMGRMEYTYDSLFTFDSLCLVYYPFDSLFTHIR